jgi:hypothetical protein
VNVCFKLASGFETSLHDQAVRNARGIPEAGLDVPGRQADCGSAHLWSNGEIKRRTDVAGIFRNDGAILLEQNDK